MIAITPTSPNQRSVSKKKQQEQAEEDYDAQVEDSRKYGVSAPMHDSYPDIPLDLLLALQDAREEVSTASLDEKKVKKHLHQYQSTFEPQRDDAPALEDA